MLIDGNHGYCWRWARKVLQHQHRLQSKKTLPGAVTMETEAMRCSKLFETVRFYSSSWTASARVGNAGVRDNFSLQTHFQLFSSPFLTSLEQMFDLFCAHSSLLGLLTKRETLRSTPALFLIRSNLAKSVFSPAAFPAFASQHVSASHEPLSSHHPYLNFHHCGDAKCTSLSGPFSIKWRAARVTNFQPDCSQIPK